MASPELLAAVTAAVKGEDPPADPPAGDPPAGDPPAGDPPAGDPPAAAQEDLVGDAGAAAPAAAAQPVLDADGRTRGPDGKFVAATPKPGDPPTAAAPAAAPPAAAAPAAPPKAPDPVNDPVPPTAKPDTRERITTLAGMVRERDTKLETTAAELTETKALLDKVVAPLEEAGASVEQFQEMVNLVRWINSPHQHEQMQALQYLQSAGAALAERLGQVAPGTDPLTSFPDLQEQVRVNPALRPLAEQAAAGRRVQQASQQHAQFTQQRTQQQQQHQQAVAAGQAAVRQVEQTLEASDPQYKAKIAVLRADTAFLQKLRGMPPAQWAPAFAEKYRTVQAAAPVVPIAAAAPAAPAPLRAKQPAGTQARPAANSLEAVKAAISGLRA